MAFKTIQSRYDGECRRCGHEFPAGTTIRWARGAGSYHLSVDCPGSNEYDGEDVGHDAILTRKPVELAKPKVDLEHGFVYFTVTAAGDETLVKAKRNQTRGTFYGLRWDGIDWVYDSPQDSQDLLRGIERKITAEEAAEFGHTVQKCIFCMTGLEDDGNGRSLEVGYGPTCAKKHGLPWGASQVAAAREAGADIDSTHEASKEIVF